MKKIIVLILLVISTTINSQSIKVNLRGGKAQETFLKHVRFVKSSPTRKVFDSIEQIVLEEKIALKRKIETIDKQLESNEIKSADADKLKKEAADIHASNIETRVALEENRMQELIQDYTNKQITTISVDSVYVDIGSDGDTKTFSFTHESLQQKKQWVHRMNNMTFQQFVVAFGINNVIENNNISSLGDSDYYFLKSNFFELGYTFKKRLSKGYTPLHFKYGVSFLFNDLVATDNRYHVKSGDQTNLVSHTKDLKNSRLKYVQFVVPLHLEFDFSKPRKIDDVDYYIRSESFRFGIGGYGGFRIYSRQILKYEEEGLNVKEKTTDNYNLNSFTYGLSSYFGYKSTTLYAKYDLNSLFKNSNTSGVSLGIRIEF